MRLIKKVSNLVAIIFHNKRQTFVFYKILSFVITQSLKKILQYMPKSKYLVIYLRDQILWSISKEAKWQCIVLIG